MNDPVLALFWFSLVGGLFGLLAWQVGALRRARSERKAEQIRGMFGEARTLLFHAAVRGEVDPRSVAYRSLYYIQTSMMRRDDQYDRLWGELARALGQVKSTQADTQLADELATWHGEAKAAALLTGRALQRMLFEYSVLLRMAVRAIDLAARLFGAHAPPKTLDRIEKFEERKHPDRRVVREFVPKLGVSFG